jgi:hypothetical protein
MPQLRYRARRSAFAQHLLHRIARHEMNHQEYQRQHQPQRRQS